MQVRIAHDAPAPHATGALVVPVFSDSDLDGVAKRIDDALGGALADVVASGEITGKTERTRRSSTRKAQPFRACLAVGLGDAPNSTPNVLARYAGTAVR